MRLYSVIIAIVLGMLLVACGGEDAPVDTAAEATVEPAATATEVEAAPAAPRPSPTSYAGGIPSPAAVSAAATGIPTAAATSETMAVLTPAPTAQPSTPTPAASTAVAVPTLTPERVEVQDDCGDFATHREAQLYFLEQGGPIDDPFGLDTDGDGIACNAETDTGYERIAFTLFSAATATPAPTATPIPTVQPLPSSADIWSSPERAAELNSIDWRAFANTLGHTAVSITPEGWRMSVYWAEPAGSSNWKFRDIECGPHFGNRLDKANPTYHIRHQHGVDQSDTLTIWIEPTDGDAPFCAKVDRFRDWKSTDRPPLDGRISDPSGRAVWGEPIRFPYQGGYTLSPDEVDYGMAIGRTFEVLEGELECAPHKMPLAVWSPGFEVLGREEEELVARYGFRGFKVEEPANEFAPGYSVDYSADSSEYWDSYDWESKEFWRNAGWFLMVSGWSRYAVEGERYPPPYREGGVIYDIVPDSDARAIHYCWRVPNVADLPEPRSCIECERHRNMSKEVKEYHERNE